jgi:hypothetical protein
MQYEDLRTQVPEEHKLYILEALLRGYTPCISINDVRTYTAHLCTNGKVRFTWYTDDDDRRAK